MAQLLKKDDSPKKKKKGRPKTQKNKASKKKQKLFTKSDDLFKIKKLHLDSRIYIQFAEFNQRCMDGFFATKKQKQRLNINTYQRMGKNQLSHHQTIPYMDVAYLILELYEGTEFPNLGNIKDPFKKYKPAIVRVGSKEDELSEEIQKRDLDTVLHDLPETDRSVVCYRIRRRVYERLMHHMMWESVPVFENQKSRTIKGSSILFPLQASNNGKKNFFRYLIGGHLMLKNGVCYRLTSMDEGFETSITRRVEQVESLKEEE